MASLFATARAPNGRAIHRFQRYSTLKTRQLDGDDPAVTLAGDPGEGAVCPSAVPGHDAVSGPGRRRPTTPGSCTAKPPPRAAPGWRTSS